MANIPIFDADCHISSGKISPVAITADELVARMDREGVSKALVWLAPPYDRNIERENAAVYAAAQRYPGRLCALGWVNPNLGRKQAEQTIARCLDEYGLLGIKFNGAQDDYVIDDDNLVLPLIEQAAAYGKPIAFHIGADFYENSHPYRMGRVAGLFPEIPMLMVHMGGVAHPDLTRAAIETAEAHANITLVASHAPYTAALQAIELLGPRRVAWGSDSPFGLLQVELAAYRALLRDLPDEAQRLVLGGTIAQVLGVGW